MSSIRHAEVSPLPASASSNSTPAESQLSKSAQGIPNVRADQDRRAISRPLTTVSNGQLRLLRSTKVSSSAALTVVRPTPSKLVILPPAPSRIRGSPAADPLLMGSPPLIFDHPAALAPRGTSSLRHELSQRSYRNPAQTADHARHDQAHHKAPVPVADALGMNGKKHRAGPARDHRGQLDPDRFRRHHPKWHDGLRGENRKWDRLARSTPRNIRTRLWSW